MSNAASILSKAVSKSDMTKVTPKTKSGVCNECGYKFAISKIGGKCKVCEGLIVSSNWWKDTTKKDDIFEIRCFLNRKRKKTHELSKSEALSFKNTAQHLIWYLEAQYKV